MTVCGVDRSADPEAPNSPLPGGDVQVLLALIQAYEARHHPVEPTDPIEAIQFHMKQQGLTPKDLAPMIGRPNQVVEVLSQRWPLVLVLVLIRKLREQLGISAKSLIGAEVASRVT